MPESAAKIWAQLGMTTPLDHIRLRSLEWGQIPAGRRSAKLRGVFPRIELKEAVEKMRAAGRGGHGGTGKTARQASGCRRAADRVLRRRRRKDRDRRFRQGRSARGPGAVRRAGEGRRQAAASEGGYRRAGAAHHRRGHRACLYSRNSWWGAKW